MAKILSSLKSACVQGDSEKKPLAGSEDPGAAAAFMSTAETDYHSAA